MAIPGENTEANAAHGADPTTIVMSCRPWLFQSLQILASGGNPDQVNDAEHQDHFEATYEDVWEEVTKYGEVSQQSQSQELIPVCMLRCWHMKSKCLNALCGTGLRCAGRRDDDRRQLARSPRWQRVGAVLPGRRCIEMPPVSPPEDELPASLG